MAVSSVWRTTLETLRSCSSLPSDLSHKAANLPTLYADYVSSNPQSVGQVENGLRNLTYLLPGARLQDSELAAESVHTFVSLISVYHDHLLKKRSGPTASSNTSPSSKSSFQNSKRTPHARYTTFWSDSSSTYTKVATLLKLVQYTELLWEMTARRRGGEKSRWRVVVFLESFKALLRLVLMRLTRSRLLVTPPLPQREDFINLETQEETTEEPIQEEMKLLDPMPFEPKDAFSESGILTPPMSESDKIPHVHHRDPFAMPRTGFTMPSMPSPDAVSSYLLEHVITPDDIKPVQQLIRRLTSFQGQAAELLYILRPVIYAVLMQNVARRYGYEGTKWKKVWSPWLVGITIEYFARQLAKSNLSSQMSGPGNGLSTLEREEFNKRGWNMAWWGMRGAFYENITKAAVDRFANALRGKPILDLAGGVVDDYEHLWSNFWFSTSTM